MPATPFARRIWLTGVILATVGYYFWTAMIAAGGLPRIHGAESDHFNLLSRGFQKGQLNLDLAVPEALRRAQNPYDPSTRGAVTVLHDASYYRGKYYIYFGPAPVVTLLLPFSVLTGRDLPLPYAVWVFSSVGYLALAGGFLFLQRRHFPRASGWTVTAGLIAIGGASQVVPLLRRANIWEMSAASGFAFFALSMGCLIRALHSPRAIRWAAGGGVALGLAVAARPTYLICSVLFALPVVFRSRGRARDGTYGWRALAAAAAGCVPFGLGLAAYNVARFGQPLEFGMTYQLTSVIESESRHFSASYVPFNFHLYFLSVLPWRPYFPFVDGIVLPPLPPGHGGHEYTYGLLPNLPFVWLAAVAIGYVGWQGKRGHGNAATPAEGSGFPWRASLGVIVGAAVLNAGFLLIFFGSCLRYMVDFTPWLMVAAALGACAGESDGQNPAFRRCWRGGVLLLAGWSAFTAAVAVVRFYDPPLGDPPAAYRPVARAFNYPGFLLQTLRWSDFGPREFGFRLPADRTPRQEVLATVKRGERTTAEVLIDYLDDTRIRFGYRETPGKTPAVFSPARIAPTTDRHALRLSVGGPYADFDGRRGRLRAEFDGVPIWDVPAVSPGAYPGEWQGAPTFEAAAKAKPFSGRISDLRAITMPEQARTIPHGMRVQLPLSPEMAGRAFPLLTTGRRKAGDMFFIEVLAGGKVRFGYDHWGHPVETSPVVPWPEGKTRVVEFWLPGLAASEAGGEIVVRVDGTTVWRNRAAAYPVTPETFFPGRNPIGGSHCEVRLDDAVFEDLAQGAPRP